MRNIQRNVSLTISSNQDMVVAIIAESTLDCIVSSYWFRLLTRGSLRPNMGVLRMARSAVMETREDSNQHVFRFCGFSSSLVNVIGRSCWGTAQIPQSPQCHKQFEPSATGLALKGSPKAAVKEMYEDFNQHVLELVPRLRQLVGTFGGQRWSKS